MLPPVDFPAMRAALVAGTRAATGLGQNAVIMLHGFDPVAVRPQRPFATVQIQSPSIRHGGVCFETAGKYGDDAGRFVYSMQRSMVVAFQFFADLPEDASGLAASLQFACELQPIRDLFQAGGLSVWRARDVLDLTTSLATGYEGRAAISVEFGYIAQTEVDVGVIEHVPVEGTARDEEQAVEAFSFTADI